MSEIIFKGTKENFFLDRRPLEGRFFLKSKNRQIVAGFKLKEILRLSETKNPGAPAYDTGKLMPFLPELHIGFFPKEKNVDLWVLGRWCQYFKSLGVPFVVTRRTPEILQLWKERVVTEELE